MIEDYEIPEIDQAKIGERLGELFLIACLYHDIGKLVTHEDEGYEGHAEAGAVYFKQRISLNLGLNDKETEIVTQLIGLHLATFDYIRDKGDRASEPVENLGIVDLTACYMEHWLSSDEITVPKRYVTPDLRKLKGVMDFKNHHVKDMLTHSLIAFHIAELLMKERHEDEEISNILLKSGGERDTNARLRGVSEKK